MVCSFLCLYTIEIIVLKIFTFIYLLLFKSIAKKKSTLRYKKYSRGIFPLATSPPSYVYFRNILNLLD
jgi:hypothetical protein